MKKTVNERALNICLAVHAAGGTAYLVGGLVRDMFVDRDSKDWDIEVFGLSKSKLEAILFELSSKIDFVGASYGVYKVDGDLDVSFPRLDYTHGKGAEVESDPFMSIEDAAKRRDLTINAIYFDPILMRVTDPYNGRGSLYNKIIRHVSEETFHKDPLRPVRASRFHALLNFGIDYNTICLCRQADPEKLKEMPKDRLFWETVNVLMNADKPSMFFRALHNMCLLKHLFPELHGTMQIEQGKVYHPEGSVFEHTMRAIDAVPKEERTIEVMLAVLFHDLGKRLVPNVVDGDKIHFYGHAEETSDAQAALLRLTNDKDLTAEVLKLIRFHMRPYDLKKDTITKKLVRRLAAQVDMRRLLKVHRADRLGRGLSHDRFATDNIAHVDTMLSMFEEIESEIKPIITGRHLIEIGIKPYKGFGEILRVLYDHQLDEQFSDVEGGKKLANTLFAYIREAQEAEAK